MLSIIVCSFIWAVTSISVVAVVPVDDWAIGVGGGGAWLEHSTVGDNTAPQFVMRLEPCLPVLWFEHNVASGFESWSIPIWILTIAIGVGVLWRFRAYRRVL